MPLIHIQNFREDRHVWQEEPPDGKQPTPFVPCRLTITVGPRACFQTNQTSSSVSIMISDLSELCHNFSKPLSKDFLVESGLNELYWTDSAQWNDIIFAACPCVPTQPRSLIDQTGRYAVDAPASFMIAQYRNIRVCISKQKSGF